ncbi:MAG: 50S ribosomal protein L10 [Minisyncoccia bacterium]|jgi:large subunit ribosomal protein L10
MAISKEKKREIVAKLADAFKEASSVAFVGFTRLSVADASKMRKQLSQVGVRYFVAKKTLIRKALEGCNYSGEVPALPGEVAVAWTKKSPVGDADAADDITAPARGVHGYGKKLKGALALLGGVFEGVFIDAERALAIAAIPSMPVLRGMFVNVINSPIQGLVFVLDQISKKKQ